jgi:hypothetical protein
MQGEDSERKRGSRLSYANVMSTLAIFLVIGGGAYAASKINGRQLQNKSIAGRKIKNDTITGRQVKESKLGTVPSASTANSANTAQTANTANTASTADNALQLGGLNPSAFEGSHRILFGSGRSNAGAPQALFSSSVANFDLTTDGDADNLSQLRLVNNNGSGNVIGTVFTRTGPPTAFGVPHGAAQQIGPATGAGTDSLDTLATDAGSNGKSVWIHCLFQFAGGIPNVFCWGIQAS